MSEAGMNPQRESDSFTTRLLLISNGSVFVPTRTDQFYLDP